MLLASVPFGTRPYRRQSLPADVIVHEDRDAVEAVDRKRPFLAGYRIQKTELDGLDVAGYRADKGAVAAQGGCEFG